MVGQEVPLSLNSLEFATMHNFSDLFYGSTVFKFSAGSSGMPSAWKNVTYSFHCFIDSLCEDPVFSTELCDPFSKAEV